MLEITILSLWKRNVLNAWLPVLYISFSFYKLDLGAEGGAGVKL